MSVNAKSNNFSSPYQEFRCLNKTVLVKVSAFQKDAHIIFIDSQKMSSGEIASLQPRFQPVRLTGRRVGRGEAISLTF